MMRESRGHVIETIWPALAHLDGPTDAVRNSSAPAARGLAIRRRWRALGLAAVYRRDKLDNQEYGA
jgi:hypothetical protein